MLFSCCLCSDFAFIVVVFLVALVSFFGNQSYCPVNRARYVECVETIVQRMTALHPKTALNEHKIILCSSQLSFISIAAETIRILMNPFEWHHIYVPVLPRKLIDFTQVSEE